MIQYTHSNVSYSNDVLPGVKAGRVTVIGENPNCTVRISEHHGRRFRSVDRILGATVDTKGKQVKITGRSEHLASTVGAEDPIVTVTITRSRAKECVDCP